MTFLKKQEFFRRLPDFEGKTFDEIGEELNCKPVTIKGYLHEIPVEYAGSSHGELQMRVDKAVWDEFLGATIPRDKGSNFRKSIPDEQDLDDQPDIQDVDLSRVGRRDSRDNMPPLRSPAGVFRSRDERAKQQEAMIRSEIERDGKL